MSSKERELQLKLTIDGKEAVATVELTKVQVTQLNEELVKSGMQQPFKLLKNDLLEVNEISEEVTEGIVDFIKMNQLSEDQLQQVIQTLQKEKTQLGIGSQGYVQREKALANLNNAYNRLKTNQAVNMGMTGRATQGFTGMNMVIGQTGFLLSDLDMMFVNTRMGLMSISNNISMLVNTMGVAIAQSKTAGLSLAAMFKQALTPMNLAVLGVNAFLFVINALSKSSSSATSELNKQSDAVAKLGEKYKELAEVEQKREIEKLKKERKVALAEMEHAAGKTKKIAVEWGMGKTRIEERVIGRDEETYDAAEKKITEIDEKLKVLNGTLPVTRQKIKAIMSGTYDVSSISNVRDAVKALEKEFENVRSDAEREKFRSRIDELKELENGMRGVEETTGAIKKQSSELGILTLLWGKYVEVLSKAQKYTASPVGLAGLTMHGAIDVPVDKPVADTTTEQSGAVQLLGDVWQRTGNIMASALSRGLGLLRQTDNILQNILGSVLEIGLQMGITGLFGGLFSLFGGGAFGAGFLGALGIKGNIASPGVMNDSQLQRNLMPSPAAYGPIELSLSVDVSGRMTAEGDSLVGVYNKRMKIKKQMF